MWCLQDGQGAGLALAAGTVSGGQNGEVQRPRGRSVLGEQQVCGRAGAEEEAGRGAGAPRRPRDALGFSEGDGSPRTVRRHLCLSSAAHEPSEGRGCGCLLSARGTLASLPHDVGLRHGACSQALWTRPEVRDRDLNRTLCDRELSPEGWAAGVDTHCRCRWPAHPHTSVPPAGRRGEASMEGEGRRREGADRREGAGRAASGGEVPQP